MRETYYWNFCCSCRLESHVGTPSTEAQTSTASLVDLDSLGRTISMLSLSALGWYHTLVRSIQLLLSVRRWRRYKSIEMNGTIWWLNIKVMRCELAQVDWRNANVLFEWQRIYVTKTLPSARSTAPRYDNNAAHLKWQFCFWEITFIHIKQLRETVYISFNARRLCVWGL